MLNSMRDKNEGTYRGEEGTTPDLRPRLVQKIAVETSYELSWKVKVMDKKTNKIKTLFLVRYKLRENYLKKYLKITKSLFLLLIKKCSLGTNNAKNI